MKLRLTLAAMVFIVASCTQNNSTSNSRVELLGNGIINGDKVTEFTDIRSSTVLVFAKGNGVCTGTLIAENVVLTAAHCIPATLIGFAYDISDVFKIEGSKAARLVVNQVGDPLHDENDPGRNSVHDLALIKFDGVMPDGFVVRNLPEKKVTISESDSLEMIGYGRTSEGLNDAGVLHSTSVPASQILHSIYDVETKQDYALPGNIVVNQPETGTCRGDSGGPLYVRSTDGSLTLIGVASKAGNLANEALFCHGFSIYVDLRNKLDWIQKAILEL